MMKIETQKLLKRILIVDDNLDNIGHLFDFLTQAGFKVGIARDGESAIESVIYSPPDLILLDIMMPGISGFDVCKELKNNLISADIPIIFMTALDDTVNKLQGFALGAADYVTKPIHYEEVLARINTHLKLRDIQQQLQAEVAVHKHTSAELVKRTAELEKRNRELNAFAHTVSHDLKTPLGSIMTLSELLIEEFNTLLPKKDHRLERLNYIFQAGQQGINIIDALLLLAGVSCRQKVELSPLDMKDIVNRVIYRRLHLLIQRYQATFDIAETFPYSLGYAPWVEEIWTNYISNALKYGGSPPHLIIGANILEETQKVRFWVKDNGGGIDEEMRSELFTPFTRLETRRVEGHGLGLSIVQQITEKLNGEVGAESLPKEGSLFYFTLPLIQT
jgi:two-component system, sensor histidine kinase and response regulator